MILYTFQTDEILNEQNKRELLNRSLLDYCAYKSIRVPVNGFEIIRTSKGKPLIENMSKIQFSISHTKNLFLCGVQDSNLGIDVEDILLKESLYLNNGKGINFPERYLAIARRFFSSEENEYIKTNGFTSFFQIWVRKEAYIKAKGTGISEGLSKFSVIENGKFADTIEGMYVEELQIGKYIGGYESKLLAAYCSSKPLVLEMHSILNK